MEDLSGQTIGQIKISSCLGEGGMGAVYVGEDEKLKRRVAVKVLHANRRLDAKATARFLREAQILSQLNHPNICNVFEFFEDSDMDVLVLEYIQGQNLDQINHEELKFTKKVKIVRDVARALAAAHAQSVVHRDLKPQNVMVTEKHQVKVLDFGLASARGARLKLSQPPSESKVTTPAKDERPTGDSNLTEIGDIMGTPRFMSPEQARGETVTAAGDMYSLGLLIQNFFTGSSPYQEDLSNSALLFKAMNADTLPLQGVDTQLTRLINGLKSPNAQDRPTAGAVVEELNRILNRPKRRLKILAIAGFITVLCLGTLLSTIGFVKAKRSEKRATQAQAQSDAINDFLRTTLSAASPYELGIDVKVRDVLAHASEHIEANFGEDPLMRAAVHHTLGHTYSEMGSYEDARQHLEQAKKLREQYLDIDHPETLKTLHRLGILVGKQGELDHAEKILKDVLERYKVTMGQENREVLSVMTSLSTIYLDKKEFPKAEALCRENLALSRATLGPNHEHTASSLNGLAIVLCNQRRFSEGESLFRETLAIKRKKLGDAHPSTLDVMHNLASALHVQKKYDLAEPLIRETLQLTSRIMGPEHPSTLRTRNNLALTLTQLDKNEAAEKLLRENLALDRKILGENHKSTLSTQNNLGMALFHQKRFAEAEILFRDTLEKRRLTFPPDHPDVPSSLENVANALAWQKKFDEAKPLYEEALTLNTSAYGKGHPTTIALGCKLASTLRELGQNDKALELIQKTRDQSEESLGPDHVLTVDLRTLYEQWAPDGEE